jgi:osmoprotectant transport system ATP-binding protein
MIRFDGVRKAFGGTAAVNGVTLEVPARTTVALLGPSGCGKSTLLRMAIGLVAPDAGTVAIAGERMTPESARSLRLRMGYVIQEGGLFPHLTAKANVALMARYLGWAPDKVDARVAELAELVRLDVALLARFPVELSGGQRQRVGMMRALMLDPEVLLLDEPMGALDPMVRRAMQEDLKEIFAELAKTVLLVTHDLAEAAFLAEDVVLMSGGDVVQRGSIAAMARAPASRFVTDFLRAQAAPEAA